MNTRINAHITESIPQTKAQKKSKQIKSAAEVLKYALWACIIKLSIQGPIITEVSELWFPSLGVLFRAYSSNTRHRASCIASVFRDECRPSYSVCLYASSTGRLGAARAAWRLISSVRAECFVYFWGTLLCRIHFVFDFIPMYE